MLGKMVVSKPIYVAHAQRKEDRIARLQVCIFPIQNFQLFTRCVCLHTFSRNSFCDQWIKCKRLPLLGTVLFFQPYNIPLLCAGSVFSDASSCSCTFCWSSLSNVSSWSSRPWTPADIWSGSSCASTPGNLSFVIFLKFFAIASPV